MPTTPPPGLDPARLDAAFDLVARQVASGRTTYAALVIARGDRVVRSEAHLRGERLEKAPRSAIASITKPITAIAVLQLVESGLLVLTEPLETYIPDFRPAPAPDSPPAPEPITAWHVLSHTAGLTDATDDWFRAAPPTKAAVVARLCVDPLRFPPGTAYAYASDSFYLLAELVERLSGVPYQTYLEERIFRPLGMSATGFDPAGPGPGALPLEGSFGPPDVPYDERIAYLTALAMPGGGLWSTPGDVARFGRAMLLRGSLDGTRVLGRPFVELMVRHHTADVREIGTNRRPDYALGWGLPGLGRGSPVSRSTFGHMGASGSVLLVDPANDLVVVYLRNEWGAPITATDEAVQAIYAALD